MKPIIELHHIGKKYRLQQHERYISLRDSIATAARQLLKKDSGKEQDFWALEDINLSINPGERLGIIGKNGAGKSTLLKILSRITPPTTGHALLRGKFTSLLEVGTGFHPELTGRENIYFNGSVLGLKKAEIDRRFDAIVDFSGVALFLDMPLKKYSSGMELRLAFAVAAHLEQDILLIDEVLAVGDMDFQKKCIGKMEEISTQQGKTILFVSHNMNYISSFCNKAVLLDKGHITLSGDTAPVVSQYLSGLSLHEGSRAWQEEERPGNDIVRLISVKVTDAAGNAGNSFKVTERIAVEMKYEVLREGNILWLGHNIYNQYGINVFDTHSVSSPLYKMPHQVGIYTAVVWIPGNFLNAGNYYIGSAVFNHLQNIIHFHEKEVLMFHVYDVFDEETARGMSNNDFPGIIRPLLEWMIEKS